MRHDSEAVRSLRKQFQSDDNQGLDAGTLGWTVRAQVWFGALAILLFANIIANEFKNKQCINLFNDLTIDHIEKSGRYKS
jgi:hypothetical protein